MSFKRNDIVNKQRLRDALEEDTSMGFAHNDIVTTYAMDKAIAEGGGGGGDFSTAEVTIVDNVGDGIDLELPLVYEAGEAGEGAPAMLSAVPVTFSSGVYKVTLYKNNLLIDIAQEVTTSGSITNVQDITYLITGDCTITISEG